MKLSRNKNHIVSLSFREGRYLDLWTVVHISTGLLLASLGTLLPLCEPWPFFIAVVLLIIWELIEIRFGIGEHMENIITDILIGCCGYGLALLLFARTDITALALGLSATIVIVVFDVLGIRSYRRRQK